MNLTERIKKIITRPKAEWQVIAAETTTAGELFTGYIIPLAAIAPIASIIGMSLFGITVPFVGTYRVPIGTSLVHGLVSYVLALAGVYVVALIINALAPTFAGEKDNTQALKVAAYASTAAWLGGIFSIIPAIGVLGAIAGLYSLYLLYLGLPVLMKTPPEKGLKYTIVVIIASIVVFVLVGLISGALISYPAGTASMPAIGTTPEMLGGTGASSGGMEPVGATALTAFKLAREQALSWQPDAKLEKVMTVYAGSSGKVPALSAFGMMMSWDFIFSSASANKAVQISTNGKEMKQREAPDWTRFNPISEDFIDSDQALAEAGRNGYAVVDANNMELTIQHGAKKFQEPVWMITDYQTDFYISAKSGKLIEKGDR